MAKSKTLQPNPVLKQLEFLVGNWNVEMFNASFLPDPATRVPGKVSFEWVEDGA